MAAKAIAHVQIHGAHSRALLQQIAMAARACDAGSYVRSMVEPDVGGGAVVVNAHPRNVFAARLVGGHFSDFGPVSGDDQMATHAELHAGNGRIGSLIDAGVASLALQPSGEMHIVREGDGLRGLSGMPVQEIANGGSHGAVRGRKNSLCWWWLRKVRSS